MSLRRISNPPNPWHSTAAEWLDAPEFARTQVFEETAKSILSKNDSPDIPFRFSLNPYRGCHHACSYCYARVSHQYWDFGAGTDFETKLVVKPNAPDLLRKTLLKRSWEGDWIALSGNTDCYQPLEACYQLTRRCLQVLVEFRNPVGIITKSCLIRRDIDLLQELEKRAKLSVYISIPFSDDKMARAIESQAPLPSARFAAMKALSDAGISVGVAIAPIIPGLNDSQVPEILKLASESGAKRAFRVLLRLPAEVEDVFFGRLTEEFPDRVEKVTNGLRETQAGKLYRSEFGVRGRGDGPRWEAIDWLFKSTCNRLGITFGEENVMGAPNTFLRPGEQLTLFGEPVSQERKKKRDRA